MIGRLSGTILECSPGQLLLDVAGVGYLVLIPLSTFYRMSGQARSDGTVWIHTHVREDALQLFGFATQGERAAFERLIAISGVGPKIALAVLSGIGVDELAAAVERSDRQRLEKIPGVGRKTAERILLELRENRPSRGKPQKPAAGGSDSATDLGFAGSARDRDAASALENLGYSADRARRAVEIASAELGEGTGLEDVLRAALRGLTR